MTFEEAFEDVIDSVFYNYCRLHGTIKGHSPAMFLKKWINKEIQNKKIAV
jgi:transposase InsO family protein